MSTTINNGLVNAEEIQANTIKPNSGTSVAIQDADGNERIVTTSTGVGIGTDSPQKPLHVTKDAAADPSYALNQPVIIEDDNRPGIQLVGSAGNIGLIEFGDNVHPNAGSINYDHSTDRLRFGFTDDAEKVYIDSSGNMVISGDLTVNGATTTLSTTNSVVEDKLIELGNGVTGTPSGDAGIIIERGSSDNAAIVWDESRDEFVLGTTTATGASTGDLTVTPGNISVERIGAGTEQAEAEVHAKRDVSSGGQYSTTATVIAEDDTRPSIQLVGSANNIGLIQFGDNAAVASGQIYYDHSTDKLRVDCGGSGDRVTVDASGNVVAEGSLILKEKADAVADVAAYGQLWTKNSSPAELYFTTDAGDDIQITDGTALAGGGGGASALDDLSDVDYSGGDLEIASLDKIVSGSLVFDSSGDITLDVDGDDITFKAGSDDSTGLKFTQSGSGDWTILAGTSDKDIVFQGNDGGVATEILRIDASEPAVLIKGGAASSGKIRIYEDSDAGVHYAEINTPALAASYSLTLPIDDGDANEVLTTDGSGALSWGPPAIYAYEAVTSTPGSALTTQQLVSCNPTSGAIVLTMPAASTAGKTLTVKNASAVTANTITINRAGSDTIDGETSIVMSTAYSSITMYSDGGTGWWII